MKSRHLFDRRPMTKTEKAGAFVMAIVEFGKFIAEVVRNRRNPKRADEGFREPFEVERVESGRSGTRQGTE